MTNQRKVFIDCGTHMGTGFSKLCDSFGIDSTWEVYGFEPNEYAFDAYVENIKSEKFSFLNNKNFNLSQKAVWIEDGQIEFCMEILNKKEFDENERWREECYKHEKKFPLEKLAIEVPSSGGSCVKDLREKLQREEAHEKLYEWNEPVLVDCIDFSKWITENFSKQDLIIVKMDIEGSEYKILPKMIEENTISYINTLCVEWHDWVMPEFKDQTSKLQQQLMASGVRLLNWG